MRSMNSMHQVQILFQIQRGRCLGQDSVNNNWIRYSRWVFHGHQLLLPSLSELLILFIIIQELPNTTAPSFTADLVRPANDNTDLRKNEMCFATPQLRVTAVTRIEGSVTDPSHWGYPLTAQATGVWFHESFVVRCPLLRCIRERGRAPTSRWDFICPVVFLELCWKEVHSRSFQFANKREFKYSTWIKLMMPIW